MKTPMLRFVLQRLSMAFYRRGLTTEEPCPHTGQFYLSELVEPAQALLDAPDDPLAAKAAMKAREQTMRDLAKHVLHEHYRDRKPAACPICSMSVTLNPEPYTPKP